MHAAALSAWESSYVIVGSSGGALIGLQFVVITLAGLVYVISRVRRARRQTEYKPVLEDWIWYLIFPAASYGVLSVAGVTMARGNERILYPVAAVALALLLIGIHNAWDTVTHIAMTGLTPSAPSD